jgi:hypothetical protein
VPKKIYGYRERKNLILLGLNGKVAYGANIKTSTQSVRFGITAIYDGLRFGLVQPLPPN